MYTIVPYGPEIAINKKTVKLLSMLDEKKKKRMKEKRGSCFFLFCFFNDEFCRFVPVCCRVHKNHPNSVYFAYCSCQCKM